MAPPRKRSEPFESVREIIYRLISVMSDVTRALIAIALVILTFIVVLPAGSGAGDASRAGEKWTILIYMGGDCDLEDAAIDDLNELEKVGSSDDVDIIVQLDRHPDFDQRAGNWTDTRRFRIVRDQSEEIVSTQLQLLGEKNMADPQVLRDFLEWGIDSYPADHYMLSMWGHGYGVTEGLCPDSTSSSEQPVMRMDQFGSAFRSVAISRSITFDVVSLDICWGGMAEIAAEIMDNARYMIAAFDETPAPGWPYDLCIPEILDTSRPLRERLINVVDAFMSAYDIDGKEYYATLAAIDLEGFRESLIPAWTVLSEEMFYSAFDERALYDSVVGDVDHTKRKDEMVDLFQIAEFLSKISGVPERVREASVRVMDSESAVIVHHEEGTYHQVGARSFGIYHPLGAIDARYLKLRMSRMTAWDDYIKMFTSEVQASAYRVNWTAQTPPSVQFRLTTVTPGIIKEVRIETGSGTSFSNHTMSVSGGYYNFALSGHSGPLQYRYWVRTLRGSDISFPPDGYEELRFGGESDGPTADHWPPLVLDPTAGANLVFHVRDPSGIDLSGTALYFREKGATSFYGVPLKVISHDTFRGIIALEGAIDWIDAGSTIEYHLISRDGQGNTARAPVVGEWEILLGEGKKFYIDGRHSKLDRFGSFLSLLDGTASVGEVGDSALTVDLLSGYKSYVLTDPSYSFAPGEIAALRTFHQEGGEVLLVMDPSDRTQEAIAFDVMTMLDAAKGSGWDGGLLSINPFTELGPDLPGISAPGGGAFKVTGDAHPVYLVPGGEAALLLSHLGKGRAIVSVSGIFTDDVMDRAANRNLAREVIDHLAENLMPSIAVTQSPSGTVRPKMRIEFDLSGSMDRDGEILIYSMQVSGESYAESSDPEFSFIFGASGLYSLIFKVTDAEGMTATMTWSVKVNSPPSTLVTIPSTEVHSGEPLVVDYIGEDPECDIVSVVWDFGDGSKVGTATASHIYRDRGTYTLTLLLRDSSGMEATWETTVTVLNSDPLAVLPRDTIMVNGGPPYFTGPQQVTLQVMEGDEVMVSSDGTYDPDRSDELNITWEMGDGSVLSGNDVTYAYKTSGLFIVTLVARDGFGGIDTESLSVYVINSPPTSSFTIKDLGGARIEFDASASLDDPWDLSGLVYIWEFGDGEELTSSEPRIVHDYGFGGRYKVNLTVSDSDGATSSVERRVTASGLAASQIVIALALIVIACIVTAFIAALRIRRKMIEEDRGLLDLFRGGNAEVPINEGFSHMEKGRRS